MEFRKETAFINRQRELAVLKAWIEERPERMLCIFGPKSSGKTTLLYKFIECSLKNTRFQVKHFNLRKILISNYRDFVSTFFEIDYSKAKSDIREQRQYNLGAFKLTVDALKGVSNKDLDPFVVMERELQKLKAKGRQPVIVIDELQALDAVYLDDQRLVINELLNFFVAMTKESHLCHIVLASSDGYFVERLYNDSKLRKTTELLEVDYLPREDIVYWLENLEKESRIRDYVLSPHQIEAIWEHFGGSIWEVSEVLGKFLSLCEDGRVPDAPFQQVIEDRMVQARSYFMEYAVLHPQRTALLALLASLLDAQGRFNEQHLAPLLEQGAYPDREALRAELHYLVRNNYLYYNPARAEYKAQGRSMHIGMGRFVREMDEMKGQGKGG
ncbi:ATP-binding protein [Desulfonatronum thioautotrophicum]|uniref:ATP-binding protein n=1 Tax=Desulfonatronum thioautotrophicum TaxID=617001 RepID=UPI0005EAD15F|nr:ATP-binding protein [Desulfonatronum thioautotrophicum]